MFIINVKKIICLNFYLGIDLNNLFLFLLLFPNLFSGIFPKASCSRTSQKAISSISHENILDSYSYKVYRTNGSSSKMYIKDKRVLDAIDDIYDGVVVIPERLPSNPNVFASMLRSSICHWKIEVRSLIWFTFSSVQMQQLLILHSVKECS